MRLCLDDADGPATGDEEVVGLAGAGDVDLADGDAGTGEEVELVAVLHDPAGGFEQAVDGYSGERFRFGHGGVRRLGLWCVIS